jgi:TyrR family helix-turn-helix protein
LKRLIQDVEKQIVFEKMAEYKSTRKAAKALGISQPALIKKLQKYAQTDR